MTQVSPENLDRAFALLEGYAIRGGRCPMTSGPDAHPWLAQSCISKLCRQERILVEISGQNFRRITILTGPNKGKSTAANPDIFARVWQVVGRDGAKVNGKLVDHGSKWRQQPSAPRILSREEIFR